MSALPPQLARLLEERGIVGSEQATFLNPQYEERPDPFLMRGMDSAVARIKKAIESNEVIAVWGDYDCDGVPGAALMSDFFTLIKYPAVFYIPERSEGYGLNKKGIDSLKEQHVALIITVDNGIVAFDEVTYAKKLGIDTIITDHHLPRRVSDEGGEEVEELPDAVSILNPHQEHCAYPFSELCGTGVAFKLVEAFLQKGGVTVPTGTEKWLLDLVAVATVADVVPLIGENRTLVHYGLMVLHRGRRIGLRTLLEKMRVPLSSVIEDDISFSIAPKVNASSRMKSPMLAFELLTTKDRFRADELAKELIKLNNARKLDGARVAKEVKRRLEGVSLDSVVVLGNPDWNPALLGIAASSVVETYKRTVCLWGKDGDLIKGSCRSDGSVNVVSLMKGASDSFEEYGGHEKAGGFSAKTEAVHTLQETLSGVYARVAQENTKNETTKLGADISIIISELNSSFYTSLRSLAPYGVSNPKPLMHLQNVRIEKIIYFGAHKEHVRLTLSDDHGHTIDAISFFLQRNTFRDTIALLSLGDCVSVTGSFEESSFGHKKERRLRLEALELKEDPTMTVNQ